MSGKLHNHSKANGKWKDQIREFQRSNEYAELYGIDGEPFEFEWNIFPGFTSIEIFRQIQKDLKTRQMNPEQFEGRILLSRCSMTLTGQRMEILSGEFISNSKQVSDYAQEFPRGQW